MKKILAVALLLMLGCLKVSWGDPAAAVTQGVKITAKAQVEVPVVGTKEWRDAVKQAQDLKNDGKYQEAVDAAPLNIQKAWYSLDVLRQVMGGELTDGHWGGYHFDSGTLQYLGDKEKFRAQAAVVLGYCNATTESVYSKEVETIKSYVDQYQGWINNGLPKPPTKEDSETETD